MKQWWSRLVVLAALAAPMGIAHAAADEETGTSDAPPAEQARAVVQELESGLIEVMRKAEELAFKGRKETLEPVVERTHDLMFIARVALGRHWSELDASQQQEYLQAFRELTLSTYAGRFDGYNGETFKPLEESDRGGGRWLVRSKLITGKGKEISFDYVLHRDDQAWQIINIMTDGVSDLAMKRAEFSRLMRDGGFQNLVGKIEDEAERYREESAS